MVSLKGYILNTRHAHPNYSNYYGKVETVCLCKQKYHLYVTYKIRRSRHVMNEETRAGNKEKEKLHTSSNLISSTLATIDNKLGPKTDLLLVQVSTDHGSEDYTTFWKRSSSRLLYHKTKIDEAAALDSFTMLYVIYGFLPAAHNVSC